jgi:hypothetical protein
MQIALFNLLFLGVKEDGIVEVDKIAYIVEPNFAFFVGPCIRF